MIRNLSALLEVLGVSQISKRVKKELTRLKLRKRGSFAGSTWISLILRPILEKGGLQALLGAQLVFGVAMVGSAQIPQFTTTEAVLEAELSQDVLPVTTPEGQTDTTTYYFMPVAELTAPSQYFHGGHPGIDLRAPLGSDVVAMEKGTVKQIINARFGYGRHIYVEHETGVVTLYAHLGTIVVEEGESVTAGEKLGEIGMTGWTTGPHLHFEVRAHDGSALNPLSYLKPALREWHEARQVQLAVK